MTSHRPPHSKAFAFPDIAEGLTLAEFRTMRKLGELQSDIDIHGIRLVLCTNGRLVQINREVSTAGPEETHVPSLAPHAVPNLTAGEAQQRLVEAMHDATEFGINHNTLAVMLLTAIITTEELVAAEEIGPHLRLVVEINDSTYVFWQGPLLSLPTNHSISAEVTDGHIGFKWESTSQP